MEINSSAKAAKKPNKDRTISRLWSVLPPAVRWPLLLSGSGDAWLLPLVNALAEAMGKESGAAQLLRPVLYDLALHAWELNPLSAQAASIVFMLQEQQPFLSKGALTLCKIAKFLKPGNPPLAKRIQNCFLEGDNDAVKPLLNKALSGEPANPFWFYFASYLGLRLGEQDWYEARLQKAPLPRDLHQMLLADLLFARESFAEAAALYAEVYSRTALPELLVRQGECEKRLGGREAAAICWQKALAQRPWQVNLILRLSDLLAGRDLPRAQPPGRGQILLYSWNHGQDLNLTLQELYASDLGDAGLTLLDNGSTDNTAEVACAWQERFGSRMRRITLPVNVGAPAARNWLLRTEEALAASWVVFLDDDALVPCNWLGLLGSAAHTLPEASIIGCRIVDQAAPMAMQSVDLHLEPEFDPDGAPLGELPFSLVESHQMCLDYGQFNYLRPTLSVTGCCHLLTRKGIDSTGPFDLRFSPSQFDDLERDLRAATGGAYCVYQGHLAVRHLKRSGKAANLSAWQLANVTGNIKKLMLSYPPEQLGRLCRDDLDRQHGFLLQRLEEIAQHKPA
ncbi:glycosyltransferase, partial [Desulfovibrio sp. OttesenSCG-928-A18]|nr:glycosyltransferase [Desulfovibrio sp. OttesenSCG-928-A18]